MLRCLFAKNTIKILFIKHWTTTLHTNCQMSTRHPNNLCRTVQTYCAICHVSILVFLFLILHIILFLWIFLYIFMSFRRLFWKPILRDSVQVNWLMFLLFLCIKKLRFWFFDSFNWLKWDYLIKCFYFIECAEEYNNIFPIKINVSP